MSKCDKCKTEPATVRRFLNGFPSDLCMGCWNGILLALGLGVASR